MRFDDEKAGESAAVEPFSLDPSAAAGEEDRFAEHSAAVGERIYPFGEHADGRGFLGVGTSGRVYLVEEDVALLGETIEEALENLVLGRGVVRWYE